MMQETGTVKPAASASDYSEVRQRRLSLLKACLSSLSAYHRCKKRFFAFLTFFYFPNVYYLKNVGKVQSGKQINKKHFQNNSSEIDL